MKPKYKILFWGDIIDYCVYNKVVVRYLNNEQLLIKAYNKYQIKGKKETITHRFTDEDGNILIPVLSSRYTAIKAVDNYTIIGFYKKAVDFIIHNENERLKSKIIKQK